MIAKKTRSLFLEAISFGILGTVLTVWVYLLQESLSKPDSTGEIVFADDSVKTTVGLAWLILGLSVSALFWNIVFRKQTDNFSPKWALILISSSISPVLMQMIFLDYLHDGAWKLLGADWMISLLLILAPFTLLFANRRFFIEKIQNRSALK